MIIENELHKQILISLAHNNMNITKVSEELIYHRNSIDYHIRRIRQYTGLNPLDVFDLAKLLGLERVVHCKDCKKYSGIVCMKFGIRKETDYCSIGERKDDAND